MDQDWLVQGQASVQQAQSALHWLCCSSGTMFTSLKGYDCITNFFDQMHPPAFDSHYWAMERYNPCYSHKLPIYLSTGNLSKPDFTGPYWTLHNKCKIVFNYLIENEGGKYNTHPFRSQHCGWPLRLWRSSCQGSWQPACTFLTTWSPLQAAGSALAVLTAVTLFAD